MTSSPAALLKRLTGLGATVSANGDRLHIEAPGALPDDLLAGLRARKAEVLALLIPASTPVLALRQALRQWFAMTAQEADGDLLTRAEARALLSEIRRRWDDTGPAFAKAVAREEAREHYRQSGRCPYCGKLGVFHEPEREGEPV